MIFLQLWIPLGALCVLGVTSVYAIKEREVRPKRAQDAQYNDEFRPKRILLSLLKDNVSSQKTSKETGSQDRLSKKALLLMLQDRVSEKRSCFDWWCAEDRATDTPPTRPPPTTLPPTTTTTRAGTPLPRNIDFDAILEQLLEKYLVE